MNALRIPSTKIAFDTHVPFRIIANPRRIIVAGLHTDFTAGTLLVINVSRTGFFIYVYGVDRTGVVASGEITLLADNGIGKLELDLIGNGLYPRKGRRTLTLVKKGAYHLTASATLTLIAITHDEKP